MASHRTACNSRSELRRSHHVHAWGVDRGATERRERPDVRRGYGVCIRSVGGVGAVADFRPHVCPAHDV